MPAARTRALRRKEVASSHCGRRRRRLSIFSHSTAGAGITVFQQLGAAHVKRKIDRTDRHLEQERRRSFILEKSRISITVWPNWIYPGKTSSLTSAAQHIEDHCEGGRRRESNFQRKFHFSNGGGGGKLVIANSASF